jgi:glutathione peroxidase
MHFSPSITPAIFAMVLASFGCNDRSRAPTSSAPSATSSSPITTAADPDIYALTARDLSRRKVSLATYRGKVALVVNTASECGYTPQYEGLEKLYETYRQRDFVVLAFPSDDFGGQEPGSEEEIAEFTRTKYGVTFPVFAKVHARGREVDAIFALLGEARGEPEWNFHKYVIARDGRPRAAFPSGVAPESSELRDAIEAALAEPG